MNIIQKQAEAFYQMNMREGPTKHQAFIDEVKSELYNYRKEAHKVEFLQWILAKLKMDFDRHYEECDSKENCQINETYENSLFFLQIELEELEVSLSDQDFSMLEKTQMDKKLEEILDEIKLLRLGQEITFDGLSEELDELKALYYLDKKTWKQLLLGKLTDFTAAGMVAEKISKPLLELLKQF